MSESTTTTAPAGAAPTGSAFVGSAVLNPSRGEADSLPPDMIVHGSDLFWPLVSGDASGVRGNALAHWGAAVREPQRPRPAPRGSLSTPRILHHHRAEGRS